MQELVPKSLPILNLALCEVGVWLLPSATLTLREHSCASDWE